MRFRVPLVWLAGRGPWRSRRPLGISVDVSDRCNLRCVTCSAWRPGSDTGWMSVAAFERGLHHLHGLRGLGLDLIGAEPTLNPDLPRLVAAASAAGFLPRLFSNGTRLNRALVRDLLDGGLSAATISLDGAQAETHDRLRGVAGAHQLALDAVRLLAKEGRGRRFAVSTATVVTRVNYRELPDLARLARELGAGRSSFHWVSQVPRSLLSNPEVSAQYSAGTESQLVDENEWPNLQRSIAQAAREIRSPSLALLKALGRETFVEGRFPVTSCRFVPTRLSLASNGEAYPCSHFSRVRWGSLLEQPWTEIWNHPTRRAFIERVDRCLEPACAYCCHHVHNLTLWQMLRIGLRSPIGERTAVLG